VPSDRSCTTAAA